MMEKLRVSGRPRTTMSSCPIESPRTGARSYSCRGTGRSSQCYVCRDYGERNWSSSPVRRVANPSSQSQHNRLKARSWEFLSLPNSAVEVLVDARRHGLVVLISNVIAYHLRVQEAVTANTAMPLDAGEDVRTPLGAFRVVFGIGHFNNQPSASASTQS